jgi:(p)ppGpp synthase/HD superfamily hydrolase
MASVSFKWEIAMNVERAIAIAMEAHAGQFDKAGSPYISHPLRVMGAQKTEEARIVGVLHDVVEDCREKGWTFERLADMGFIPSVIDALRLVTKVEGESYDDFILRAASNPISRAVKLADLLDNLDESRLAKVTAKDLERLEKYRRALTVLRDYGD